MKNSPEKMCDQYVITRSRCLLRNLYRNNVVTHIRYVLKMTFLILNMFALYFIILIKVKQL